MSVPNHGQTVRLLRGSIFLASMLLMGALSGGVWFIHRAAKAEAEAWTNQKLDLLTAQTERVMEVAAVAFTSIDHLLGDRDDQELLANKAAIRDGLRAIVAATPQISDIWVFTTAGDVLCSNFDLGSGELINRQDRAYFRAIVEHPASTFVGGALLGRFNNSLFFPISHGQLRPDGSLARVIEISMQPGRLQDAFRVMATDRSGAYFSLIQSQTGEFIARYPLLPPDQLVAANRPQLAERRRNLRPSLRNFTSGFDNGQRQAKLVSMSSIPVIAIAGIESSALTAAWLRSAGLFLLLTAPMAALVIFLLNLAYRRTQTMMGEFERRLAAEATMRRSQRMEVLGQLTGGIAHDLNNLLMVMQGGLRKLARSHSGERAFEMVQTATEKAANLTNALLSYSRQQPQHVASVDVGAYIAKAQPVLKQALRGEIELTLTTEPNCFVRVDPTELELAILNLTLNARDATASTGFLRIAVSRAQAAFVRIEVADSGCGIPVEYLDKVFEPYFTTKGIGRGTGLGLSQVYGFVKQSGGRIDLKSTVGSGTTITIDLPFLEPTAASGTEAPPPAAASIENYDSAHVLLVEDNIDVSEVCQSYLREMGMIVQTASNGQAAREAVFQVNARFDLVISDIQMPGGYGGLDLARDLRCQRPELPVILVTGYSATSQKAVDEGFVVMRKPFTPEQLGELVSKLLASKQPNCPAS